MKNINTLNGGKYDWMLSDGIKKKHVLPYIYPSDEEMKRANLRIIYLGYFMNNWTRLDNGIWAGLHGLQVREKNPIETGDIFGVDSLDEDWVALNQMIKYYKFGFGKATEMVSEEIRYRNLAREEAIELVKLYDGACSNESILSFCSFIDITIEKFWEVVGSYVNKDLFYKDTNGKWVRKFDII